MVPKTEPHFCVQKVISEKYHSYVCSVMCFNYPSIKMKTNIMVNLCNGVPCNPQNNKKKFKVYCERTLLKHSVWHDLIFKIMCEQRKYRRVCCWEEGSGGVSWGWIRGTFSNTEDHRVEENSSKTIRPKFTDLYQSQAPHVSSTISLDIRMINRQWTSAMCQSLC